MLNLLRTVLTEFITFQLKLCKVDRNHRKSCSSVFEFYSLHPDLACKCRCRQNYNNFVFLVNDTKKALTAVSLRKMSPNSYKVVAFMISYLLSVPILSAPMHKTRHNVRHTNNVNMVPLQSDTILMRADSSLCTSACVKIGTSDGNKLKHIQKYNLETQLCECFEAETLDFFRYNEILDHITFIYDRKFPLLESKHKHFFLN